jgi:hypothetical protein
MKETLKELNMQAIENGLLLPDNLSHRKDFSLLLGKPLSYREYRTYLLIDRHSGPITSEELAREIYPEYFKVRLENQAKNNIYTLIHGHIKKKLGETSIISQGQLGYISRRSLITPSVEKSSKTKEVARFVPSEGIEPPSYP